MSLIHQNKIKLKQPLFFNNSINQDPKNRIDKERKRRTIIERIYNEITLETSLTMLERSLEPKEFISWPKMSVIRG